MNNVSTIAGVVLAGAACSFFVVVPAAVLKRMMDNPPGQLWRLFFGLFSIFGVSAAMLIQDILCGNPIRNPNVRTIRGDIFIILLILDLILLFVTYTWFYYRNKKGQT